MFNWAAKKVRDLNEDLLFFFFKQKTAYELRISDWSSDVCSSDLMAVHLDAVAFGHLDGAACSHPAHIVAAKVQQHQMLRPFLGVGEQAFAVLRILKRRLAARAGARNRADRHFAVRSEEHTSELQSLMRISYAVFCFKKKIQKNKHQPETLTRTYKTHP